ncbi:MAG: amidohydrolase, partial [Oscillospiraceae bacterium]|nr:amidohydrolase [Oscillospiraceae bacterium]
YLHANAEVGLQLPKTLAYAEKTLRAYGIEPKPCGHGLSALIGSGEPCILLRADMDALPMAEESGLPFACGCGNAAHTCGHDMHTAMLLFAAGMLKETERDLRGTVKLMFQPAEETFEGAEDMIKNGILEGPAPQCALAFHVSAGHLPLGVYMYNASGTMMSSVDVFRITARGKGAHGAYPHTAIDPIRIAAQLTLSLDGLIARESDPAKACVLTVGSFHAGSAANIIPDTAVLEGTLRTDDPGMRSLLTKRLHELAAQCAAMHRGSAEVSFLSGVPPLICDPQLTETMAGFIGGMGIPNASPYTGISASASEDFAAVAARIPSAFFYLSAGFSDERGDAGAHNPKVQFNEDVLPIGAACYAHCAAQWLAANA